MNVIKTKIPDVLILEPKVFGDERGFFYESYNKRSFEQATNISCDFVQDNHSLSAKGVLRGLHYQIKNTQGKLVRVLNGAVLDVAVDIRKSSATFGQWVGVVLSSENKQQLWIPEGFAHGFLALSGSAEVLYKATDYYSPEYERCIRWDDATLAVDWQYDAKPSVSSKDNQGVLFEQSDLFA